MVNEIHTETSRLRTFKIMPRNLNVIVLSWIRLLEGTAGEGGDEYIIFYYKRVEIFMLLLPFFFFALSLVAK
jgi:hypothetical protein